MSEVLAQLEKKGGGGSGIKQIVAHWGAQSYSRATDTYEITFPSGNYILVMTKASPNGSYIPVCDHGTLIGTATDSMTGMAVYELSLNSQTSVTLTYPQGRDYSFSSYVLLG